MARRKTKPNPGSPESSPGDRLIRQLAEALDRQDIGYVVIGGQAVNQHGHSRFTRDVDFTVHLGPWEAPRIVALATEANLSPDVPDPVQWTAEMHVFPCHHPESGLGVDFSFVASAYMRLAIQRGVSFDIAGYPVRFLAIEDLLLQKVIANRSQDRIDVVELLVRHPRADFDYLRQWLRQFEEIIEERLIERFESLLKESSG